MGTYQLTYERENLICFPQPCDVEEPYPQTPETPVPKAVSVTGHLQGPCVPWARRQGATDGVVVLVGQPTVGRM